jgi:hypothetical protein
MGWKLHYCYYRQAIEATTVPLHAWNVCVEIHSSKVETYMQSLLNGGEWLGTPMHYILIENQQMHQNDHSIVMSSQTVLHVSAYQRHNQGAHVILTNYLCVGVHYEENKLVN